MSADATPILWHHSEECCGKSPIVGARYHRASRDLLTGELGAVETYEVISVDPIRVDAVFCRRMAIRCERSGRIFRPQVANFWESGYQAIDNVVSLHTKEPSGE